MRIFLTGMPGCGKTFWGEKIAHYAQMPFFDLDAYIVQREGKTVAAIFEKKGEDSFRHLETFYLHELILKHPEVIIATGGGTPCFGNNMLMMNRSGKTIYLKTSVDKLVNQLLADPKVRPLIGERPAEQKKMLVETLLMVREKYYLQSTTIIDMNQIDETTFAQNFKSQYV